MDELINTQLGRYRLLEKIGEGGMGAVYHALDTRLDCDVAVKVLLPGRESGEIFLKRFEREAKRMAKLTHPNLVKVTDYGEEDGKYYLVMPYISGGTLADLPRPMVAELAAKYLIPVARALGYAHSQGTIHRDVKPSNILLTESGEPMLTDFGIARLVDDQDGTTITKTGLGVGTPAYMAPEQIKKGYDHRVDIYALGVVLYELITGQQPFKGDTPLDTLFKHATELLPLPSVVKVDLPAGLEQVIVKALEKGPDQRYQTMEAFSQSLQGVMLSSVSNGDLEHGGMLAGSVQLEEKQEETDLEATFDELITSAVSEKVTPVSVKVEIKRRETQKLAFPVKHKWWLVGAGAVVVLGLAWGILAGVKGNGLMHGLVTKTATATSAVVPTATKTSTPTGIPMKTATPMPTLGVGSTMISAKDGMAMVYVPEGMFTMGSNDGDLSEKPAHEVYLDGYWMDKYEVRNAQYGECVADGACEKPNDTDYYDDAEYANHPVMYVSWDDAQSYCGWAGRRLPSEAEWEKAARGTDERTYPWGNESPSVGLLNYDINGNCITVVGSYPEEDSPYGASDMAGNVWEWTGDWFDDMYYGQSSYENPTGPSSGDYRAVRGGSWNDNNRIRRSATRYKYYPGKKEFGLGFRCVISVIPAVQVSTDVSLSASKPVASGTPSSSPTSEIGLTMISKVDGMEMMYVPDGAFMMGSNDADIENLLSDFEFSDSMRSFYEREQPLHEVYLDGYWIDKHEVTNAQYIKFLNDEGYKGVGFETYFGDEKVIVLLGLSELHRNPRVYQKSGIWYVDIGYGKHPVVDVTWYGAAAYCEWAGRRLPSEAEWEKAARGTDGRTYPWGNNLSCEYAKYYRCEGRTLEVGSLLKGASPYGALDMAGNVSEWIEDWYGRHYYSVSPEKNPSGPSLEAQSFKVVRGGGWNDVSKLRSASRVFESPESSDDSIGFRCVSSKAAP